MATLSELVTAIANVEGIDAERVGAIARAAREEGLIRTSGRGTSAAKMEERDAANLLIATNTAETARAAPAAVLEYRTLQAKRGKTERDFGNALEELISAAKRESLADYVTNIIALLGTVGHLGERRYANEAYEIVITFSKPIPHVQLHIGASNRRPDFIVFTNRREPRVKAGDRFENTNITHRTILAVADVLRT
jgi:hypothetical protein